MTLQPHAVAASYNRVAHEYVTHIADELRGKPLDRHLLHWFAERIGHGTACDIGCGPGHVARFLHEAGVKICGSDLSTEMVAQATQLHPNISFQQGDMRHISMAANTWDGIVAFYSLIHIPRAEIVAVLREFHRVLRPGGAVLLAFHIGDGILHLDQWWEQPVQVDFLFFQVAEMQQYLTDAGFTIEAVVERAPYVDVEHPSRRAYICAGKPREESAAP